MSKKHVLVASFHFFSFTIGQWGGEMGCSFFTGGFIFRWEGPHWGILKNKQGVRGEGILTMGNAIIWSINPYTKKLLSYNSKRGFFLFTCCMW